MFILVEEATESVAFAYVEAGNLLGVGDRLGEWV
jgi:hypothetical protein